MTTNSDPSQYGLPSAAELARLASAYFPEFDAEHCEKSILAAAQGDQAAADRVIQKATGWLASAQNAGVPKVTAADLPYAESLNYAAPAAAAAAGSVAAPSVAPASVPESFGAISPQVLSQAQFDDLAHEKKTTESVKSGAAPESTSRHLSGITVGTKSLEDIRADFPILTERVNNHQLEWFDNGATTQRPQAVIDRLVHYYRYENSNVHRAAHELAARSTDAYEDARAKVAHFLGAPDKDNIVFVRGTTEGINLVAQAFVRPRLQPGDEIIVSLLEHHANIVPWQLIAQATGAVLKVIPVDERGDLRLDAYEALFTPRTKFVSVAQVSNTLGTITPIEELIAIAHRHGVPFLVDGAQSAAHLPVNVSALDADFFVFSGHKIYGPNGIGAVYGKKELWEQAQPWQGGGNMIRDVTFERTIYNEAPAKFEAGTGSIADAVGLGAALDYLTQIGMPAVAAWEHELTQYAVRELSKVKGLHLLGNPRHKSGVLSFTLDGYPITAVGEHLNRFGIAVRAGHHCAQLVLRHFGLEGTVRPVLGLYNTPEEVDELVKALYALV